LLNLFFVGCRTSQQIEVLVVSDALSAEVEVNQLAVKSVEVQKKSAINKRTLDAALLFSDRSVQSLHQREMALLQVLGNNLLLTRLLLPPMCGEPAAKVGWRKRKNSDTISNSISDDNGESMGTSHSSSSNRSGSSSNRSGSSSTIGKETGVHPLEEIPQRVHLQVLVAANTNEKMKRATATCETTKLKALTTGKWGQGRVLFVSRPWAGNSPFPTNAMSSAATAYTHSFAQVLLTLFSIIVLFS
jgi:hypothetical protein